MVNGVFGRVWRDFVAWHSAADDDACLDCLRLLLQGRIDYLAKPDPTLWKSGDVRELLLELAVTRMTDLCDLVGHGVVSLRSYLRFLDETGWLHPGSTTAKVLRNELGRVEGTYPQAMADSSRYRLAKRLFTAMRADGVDVGDHDAVDAWVEAFNTRAPAARRTVLGVLLDAKPELGRARFVANEGVVAALDPDALDPEAPVPPRLRHEPTDEPAGTYPPVALAGDRELATAARASTLLRRVVALARWVGTGRPVSRRGELVPPDARALVDVLGLATGGWKVTAMRDVPPLTKAFYLAVETELVAVRRSGILPGPRIADCDRTDDGPGADDVVLALWEDLFDLTARSAADPPSDLGPGAAVLGDRIGRWTPRALTVLYERQSAVDLVDLVALLTRESEGPGEPEESGPPSDRAFLALFLGLSVRGKLADLAEHGAVTVVGGDLPARQLGPRADLAEAIGMPPWALAADAPGTTARLTPLGTWAVRRALLAEGEHAPAVTARP